MSEDTSEKPRLFSRRDVLRGLVLGTGTALIANAAKKIPRGQSLERPNSDPNQRMKEMQELIQRRTEQSDLGDKQEVYMKMLDRLISLINDTRYTPIDYTSQYVSPRGDVILPYDGQILPLTASNNTSCIAYSSISTEGIDANYVGLRIIARKDGGLQAYAIGFGENGHPLARIIKNTPAEKADEINGFIDYADSGNTIFNLPGWDMDNHPLIEDRSVLEELEKTISGDFVQDQKRQEHIERLLEAEDDTEVPSPTPVPTLPARPGLKQDLHPEDEGFA